MHFRRRRPESPEEARQRRLCRFMLELPPETVYHHVRGGLATLGALSFVLIGVVAWRLGQFATVAPALASGLALATLAPAVLGVRRHYRHVVAGVLVLAALLGLLAAVHLSGYRGPVALIVGPTAWALADSTSTR